jgi:hypothetical protein
VPDVLEVARFPKAVELALREELDDASKLGLEVPLETYASDCRRRTRRQSCPPWTISNFA